jgi:hypothetical protein
MFFTHASRVVAVLALVFGLMQLLLGFGIATGFIGPYEAALSRYTTASSSGEVINKGTYMILFAIPLGMLTEISYSLRRRNDQG